MEAAIQGIWLKRVRRERMTPIDENARNPIVTLGATAPQKSMPHRHVVNEKYVLAKFQGGQ
jgi:hypothetical protein